MSAIFFVIVTLTAGAYMGFRKIVIDYPQTDQLLMQYGAYVLAIVYTSIVTVALHEPIQKLWREVESKAKRGKRQTAQA